MAGFVNTSLWSLYDFSDIQLECLRSAVTQIFENLHVPLSQELLLKNGFSANRLQVGNFYVLDYTVKVLNTFRTYDLGTELELQIPIKMFYDLYVKNLCAHFGVADDKDGRKEIKIHLSQPNKVQMGLFFKSLSQSELLATSQRCSSQIDKQLLFSLNKLFLNDE